MITHMKKEYITPETQPLQFFAEAIVCTSPNAGINAGRPDYGDCIEVEW